MKHLAVAIFSVLLLTALGIEAKTVEHDWQLTYKNINPDGLRERRVISINDQWPPVPVKLNINDILVINLYNQLNEPVSIHTHGINQNHGTNHMDGAAMVTQCPIPPNHNFTYQFPVTQSGTYWIHSHFKVQYMDGLRVPLIVYDKDDPYDYDEDETISLSDWYHEDSYTNLEKYMNRDNLEGVEPIPQSGLINDHVNTTFTFKPNKKYRLRLINMSGIATFSVYIDDHEMDVIEVDGVPTKLTRTKTVQLAAGQRISVLVHTKKSAKLNYHLHANMVPDMFDYIPDDLKMNITVPVYYDRQHKHFAPMQKEQPTNYNDAFIFPLLESPALVPDSQINMTVDFMENTDGLNHGVINNIPYLPPLVPSLHTLLSIQQDLVNNSLVYGPQSLVFIHPLNHVVEIVINNYDDGSHPFHLHGHSFQVIAKGEGVFYANSAIDKIPANPTYRDTIVVPANGYIIIRFKTDNPGVWFFHCHVDWHLPAGLAATFITASELARQHFKPLSPEMIQLCLASGQPATGNAAGKEGLDLEGAPDGIRPIKENHTFILGCLVATLVGLSTIIWHVWVDPGQEDEEENEQHQDKKALLNHQEQQE